MSPKLPRDIDGTRLIRILCSRFGYTVRNRVGSHMLLERQNATGHLAVPAHKSLRVGTLGTILSMFEEQTGASRDDLLRLL